MFASQRYGDIESTNDGFDDYSTTDDWKKEEVKRKSMLDYSPLNTVVLPS